MHVRLQQYLTDAIASLTNQAPAAWRRCRLRFPILCKYLPENIGTDAVMRSAAGMAAIIAFVFGAVVIRLFPYRIAIDDLEHLRQQESSLKQAYIKRLPAVPRIDRLQAGQRQARQKLALLRQQLTGDGEQDTVMNEIDTAGRARGLRFIMFKPGASQKTSIQISAVGDYRSIARFIDDIARMPRIVMLDPLTLQAMGSENSQAADAGQSDGLLNLQATAIAVQLNASNDEPHEAH